MSFCSTSDGGDTNFSCVLVIAIFHVAQSAKFSLFVFP